MPVDRNKAIRFALQWLLTPRQREVVTRRGQGLSNEEIAEDLGITPGRVRGYHSEGTARIRRFLFLLGFEE